MAIPPLWTIRGEDFYIILLSRKAFYFLLMNNFLILTISFVLLFFAIKQYRNNRRSIHPPTMKAMMAPYLALSLMFSLISRFFSAEASLSSVQFTVMCGLSSMYLMSVAFLSAIRAVRWYVISVIILQIMSGIWYVVCRLCRWTDLPDVVYVVLILLQSACVASIYVYGIYSRMKDVKTVMRSGSVWTNVTMSVDSIYIIAYFFLEVLYLVIMYFTEPGGHREFVSVVTLMCAVMYSILALRILNSSVFVFMADLERRIVESMKISNVDTIPEPEADYDGTALLYKNLYDRILEYFLETKPYLDPNLTINDVVCVVFSNKLYISKAINRFTGRNFCQFVNYYRVVHAIELFREDNELKVQELALKSGFNSPVSFGMAFKLYMGEKPGDWCRREKMRMDKLKK